MVFKLKLKKIHIYVKKTQIVLEFVETECYYLYVNTIDLSYDIHPKTRFSMGFVGWIGAEFLEENSVFFSKNKESGYIGVMGMIAQLRAKNPELKIQLIHEMSFRRYGRLLPKDAYQSAIDFLATTDIPKSNNRYIAHDPTFAAAVATTIPASDVFGSVAIQYGYVNGHNTMLQALEYHKSSEINVALTPMIVIVGLAQDIIDNQYDSSQVEIFYVPAMTVIEFHPLVLHFSPCKVLEEGFVCGVLLPFGTNTEFVKAKWNQTAEDQLLFKTNKWLLAHVDNQGLIEQGAFPGLTGVNYKVQY